ncbi:hypothetical protein V8C86DRAFT_469128 [Haematococcus lacustris]
MRAVLRAACLSGRNPLSASCQALLSTASYVESLDVALPVVETRSAWLPGPPHAPPAQAAATIPGGPLHRIGPAAPLTQEGPAPAGSPLDPLGGGPGHLTSPDQLGPVLRDVHHTLSAMGLQPGIGCMVGDLVLVELGIMVQGVQVAFSVEGDQPQPSSPAARARAYALERTREQVLAAHGWRSVRIAASQWPQQPTAGSAAHALLGHQAGVDTGARAGSGSGSGSGLPVNALMHARMHVLLELLKQAVGAGGKGAKDGAEHVHGHGCGCH